MNHRERVEAALDHDAPDRCPMHIGFTPEFAARVRCDLESNDPGALAEPYALQRQFDQDMLLTGVGWSGSYYAHERLSEDGVSYTDEWGVGWQLVRYDTRFGPGHYTEVVSHPLADDGAISSYQPPDPLRPELYAAAKQLINKWQDEYWIGGSVACTVFETAWALRGFERVMIDLLLNPDMVEALFDIPFRYHSAAAAKLVELGVDMVWLGDDVGAQERMLMAPETWRRFLKPRMAEVIARLKSINPNVKVAYHSDGMILPIIPDLIEIGLDILNPIQPKAMDPAEVKREFSDRLCFWGTIDEQETLPFGTPDDVRAEVLLRLHTIGSSGGLIIGPTHSVQLDTPLENFWAMVNTVTGTPYTAL